MIDDDIHASRIDHSHASGPGNLNHSRRRDGTTSDGIPNVRKPHTHTIVLTFRPAKDLEVPLSAVGVDSAPKSLALDEAVSKSLIEELGKSTHLNHLNKVPSPFDWPLNVIVQEMRLANQRTNVGDVNDLKTVLLPTNSSASQTRDRCNFPIEVPGILMVGEPNPPEMIVHPQSA